MHQLTHRPMRLAAAVAILAAAVAAALIALPRPGHGHPALGYHRLGVLQ